MSTNPQFNIPLDLIIRGLDGLSVSAIANGLTQSQITPGLVVSGPLSSVAQDIVITGTTYYGGF